MPHVALQLTAGPGATFTVTNTNDTGAGSLRQAILDANGNAGADTIVVQSGVSGFVTLASGLSISEAVDINLTNSGGGNLILSGPFGVGVNTVGIVTISSTASQLPTGNLALSGGTLRAGGLSAGGVLGWRNSLLVMSGGATLDIPAAGSATFQNLSGTGTITNNSSATSGIAIAGGNATLQTFNGTIGGSGSFTMFGGGERLTLGGATTYSGATSLFADIDVAGTNAFTLELIAGAANVFSANSAFALDGAATLNLNGFNQTIGSLEGFTVSGAVPIVSLGAGTLTAGGNDTSTSYFGSITGTGGITKTGTGVMTLQTALSPTITSTINYSGVTLVSGGTLSAGNAGAFSPNSSHNLVGAGSTLDLAGFAQTVSGLNGTPGTLVTLGAATLTTGSGNAANGFAGVMSGSGGLTKVGTGTLTLSGINTYTGATTIDGGVLQVSIANGLSPQTAVTIGAAGELETNANQAIGSLAGSGLLDMTFGTVSVGGNNASTTFSGIIQGGIGRFLEKNGTGTMTISGNSPNFFGEIEVNAGTLVHNGDTRFASTSIFAGGTLMGSGRLGTTTIIGTLAPGNSIGTITTGSIFFGANATYVVEVSPTAADRTNANGTAQITGGTVNVIAQSGQYAQTQTYTILNSTGARTGTFAGVTSNLAFLSPSLTYDANNVYLTLVSNGISVAQFGQTPNQLATAAGLAGAGPNAPYIGPFSGLTVSDVPGALDQLSGEAHASIKGVMVEDSGIVRNAALGRVEQAFAALESAGMLSQFVATETSVDDDDDGGRLLWGHLYGTAGIVNADGNAAATSHSAGGVLLGTDGDIGNWTLGVLAGAGLTGINSRNTTGTSTDLSLGVYGGTDIGDGVIVKLGAAVTGHSIRTTRTIALPGVADTVTANYGAATLQAFAEVSKEFDLGAFEVSPFAQLAIVSHHTGAFTETGGAGAISSAASTTTAAFVTLGVKADHQFVLSDGMLVKASGSIGWRHAFADMPLATNSFAAGGPFTVARGAIARGSLVLSAALEFDVGDDLDLKLGYEGALSAGASSHAVKLTLSGRF